MKIDPTLLYKINGTQSVQPERTAQPNKKFSVPAVKENRQEKVSPADAAGLNKILSAEEKRLFELLFPVTGAAQARGPVKAYAVQQNHKNTAAQVSKKTLGTKIDIRG